MSGGSKPGASYDDAFDAPEPVALHLKRSTSQEPALPREMGQAAATPGGPTLVPTADPRLAGLVNEAGPANVGMDPTSTPEDAPVSTLPPKARQSERTFEFEGDNRKPKPQKAHRLVSQPPKRAASLSPAAERETPPTVVRRDPSLKPVPPQRTGPRVESPAARAPMPAPIPDPVAPPARSTPTPSAARPSLAEAKTELRTPTPIARTAIPRAAAQDEPGLRTPAPAPARPSTPASKDVDDVWMAEGEKGGGNWMAHVPAGGAEVASDNADPMPENNNRVLLWAGVAGGALVAITAVGVFSLLGILWLAGPAENRDETPLATVPARTTPAPVEAPQAAVAVSEPEAATATPEPEPPGTAEAPPPPPEPVKAAAPVESTTKVPPAKTKSAPRPSKGKTQPKPDLASLVQQAVTSAQAEEDASATTTTPAPEPTPETPPGDGAPVWGPFDGAPKDPPPSNTEEGTGSDDPWGTTSEAPPQ